MRILVLESGQQNPGGSVPDTDPSSTARINWGHVFLCTYMYTIQYVRHIQHEHELNGNVNINVNRNIYLIMNRNMNMNMHMYRNMIIIGTRAETGS
jgi:hypothetical protein